MGLLFPHLNRLKGLTGVLSLTSVLRCSHHGKRSGRDNSGPPGDPCPPGAATGGQARNPGALGAQGVKPFHFRMRFRPKLRHLQVSQGRAPGSQLHKGQWTCSQCRQQSIWSDPTDDPDVYFTRSQAAL